MTFAEILRELEEAKPAKKKEEQIPEYRYFLIVCEGEKTEPEYFKHFKRKLPKHLVETIDIEGLGMNTTDVVQIAINKRDERLMTKSKVPYDEVWAVFDRDSFTPERVNHAMDLAKNSNVSCAFSNEAFELWYVLHFIYLDTGISRHDYIDILTEHLGIRYEKNNSDIVELIHSMGNRDLAIRYAKRLENVHTNETPANSRPSTSVYKLVEKLMKYCGE